MGSAFFLIITMCALSAIYLFLDAPFIAAAQIIIYAGAIMVLFVFIIMLLNVRENPEKYKPKRSPVIVLGLLACFFMSLIMLGAFLKTMLQEKTPFLSDEDNIVKIARLLFTDYLLPFEIVSIALLVSIIGAVTLSRKDMHAKS